MKEENLRLLKPPAQSSSSLLQTLSACAHLLSRHEKAQHWQSSRRFLWPTQERCQTCFTSRAGASSEDGSKKTHVRSETCLCHTQGL